MCNNHFIFVTNSVFYFKDWACECMELFDSLLEFEVAIVVPYLKNLIQLCLEVSVYCLSFYLYM